ncbi:ATPase, AAA family protein [Toxoplasma gondii TgCatPRC2]|nr:ATPase, AAA family protein [Toxoplasma gondii GT1]ESS32839.1 ATPase, AAA family protein [Toxoplasma gondii VEG]KFG36657.1 ATPase, AAA family protein [Toxoplasma gondii FOU]KFG41281.1 ATPase, AAA family protein [Toxoplasma gondii GAB2-2007-GAL-DOM2]KFG57458.1 ATPase, AAA family protein [Toxoplasma gondii RUB]KFH00254.1 ATPase, AAA family protein [Toxoplasma gondii VAND]KFH06264.1 ATPase, AAA family protein [Toxoplasma gondii MAS]KYK66724.1 ATPase, AAA family protein [Toxoplasma gondii TgCa
MYMRHRQITPVHFLTVLLEVQGEFSIVRSLEQCGANVYELKKAMSNVLIKLPTSADVEIVDELESTPQLKRVALRALEIAQKDKKQTIGMEHLITSLFEENNLRKSLEQAGCNVKVFLEHSTTMYENKFKQDVASRSMKKQPTEGSPATSRAKPDASDEEFVQSFGVDMTKLAAEGKLEPVVGRNKEIKEVLTVLSRKGKGNPCLVGEPGVGKTAVVEGLAQRLVEGMVPKSLENKILFAVDLGALIAGATYRGEFEKRMKALIRYAVNQEGRVILFIDELHMLMGAGKSDGTMDAANLLKPPMARGEIRLVGATTQEEYKIIEKDAAMERRLKPIFIEEPSTDRAIYILRKLSDKFESHHEMKISDEAIVAAVMLSHKYIRNRKLPDKAIDLLDEAAATKRVKWDLRSLNDDEVAMERKNSEQFEEETRKVEQQDQQRIEKQNHGDGTEEELKNLEKEIEEQALHEKQELVLTADDVAQVISLWTGIPLAKLTDDEKSKILRLSDLLHSRVIGQDDAVKAVADAMVRARAGLSREGMPVGSFLFLGPTGVGKTELAKALAMEMFHSEKNLIRIDMSEFSEAHSVSRLIGSPPGYVGHDAGGQLTEAVRRRPHSVVLFDEIEKGHQQILNIMLQMLDEGRLTDGKGLLVDFTNCVIILTSNVGAQYIISAYEQAEKESKTALATFDPKSGNLEQFAEAAKGAEAASEGDDSSSEKKDKKGAVLDKNKKSGNWKKEARRKILSEIAGSGLLKPEVVNRFSGVIIFEPMNPADVRKILAIQSKDLKNALQRKGIELVIDASAEEFIVQRSYTHKFGARPLKRFVDNHIGAKMAPWILSGYLQPGMRVTVVASKRNKNTLEAHVCKVVMGKCDRATRKARVLASVAKKDDSSPDDPGR